MAIRKQYAVLIVDDHPTILDMLVDALGQEHARWSAWRTRTARTLCEARQKMGSVDVILADWDLPDGNGGELIDEAPVPVVIHTGHMLTHAPQSRQIIQRAAGYVVKPSGPKIVHAALREAINGNR